MINYQDFLYSIFPTKLRELKAETPALWGKMNAQQMIEHCAYIVSFSNGRFTSQTKDDAEKMAYRKMRFFEKDVNMPQNYRVDVVPEDPMPLQFQNIEDSKMFLFNQLQRFDDYFLEHPGITTTHFTLGELNYDEWKIMHARHFRHHLKQFGLWSE